LFVLICIAVLCAAYGVGLGVRKAREAGFKIQISMGQDTQKPLERPEPEPKGEPKPAEQAVVTATEAPDEDEAVDEPAEEQAKTQTVSAGQPDWMAMKKRFQDLPEEEKQKIMAQKRKAFEGKGRGEGRGGRMAFQQLSEEDRADFRAKMEALTSEARAGEMSEEEMRQARAELFQEYGMNPQARGGRRPGGRQ